MDAKEQRRRAEEGGGPNQADSRVPTEEKGLKMDKENSQTLSQKQLTSCHLHFISVSYLRAASAGRKNYFTKNSPYLLTI